MGGYRWYGKRRGRAEAPEIRAGVAVFPLAHVEIEFFLSLAQGRNHPSRTADSGVVERNGVHKVEAKIVQRGTDRAFAESAFEGDGIERELWGVFRGAAD